MSVRNYKITVAGIFACAVFAFYAFFYPGHLSYVEQFQIFRFTGRYFADSVSSCGGFSQYLARFLMQFYYIPVLGAAVLSGTLLLIALLLDRISGRRGLTGFALSFLPSLFLAVYLSSGYATAPDLYAASALLCALSLSAAVLPIKDDALRKVISALLAPVSFMCCGPLGLAYVIAVSAHCGRRTSLVSAALLLATALSLFFFARPSVPDLLLGYGLQINRSRFPFAVWCPIALVLPSALLPSRMPAGRPDQALLRVLFIPIMLVLLALSFLTVPEFRYENIFRCESMLRKADWDGIIANASKHRPEYFEEVSSLDLALAMKGRLGDDMFKYLHSGPQSMIPPFSPAISPMYAAEIYYRCAMLSTAQRYTFETQVCGIGVESNLRCHKRLAEINAICGNRAVASRYLNELSATLFYSRWARNFDFDAPEYDSLRENTFINDDFYFNDGAFDYCAGRLLAERPSNPVARQFMFGWILLSKDLAGFGRVFDPSDFGGRIPLSYQEAYALLWIQTHDSFDGAPEWLGEDIRKRLLQFASDRASRKSDGHMRSKYGNTYWYYVFYSNLE